ncbi:hypothetical protein C8R43DRAFT_1135473 [Mycena crocata]|nr:hypothetical protein C8R43DRAFT_1135473 [Mycena crocata]
MPSSSTLPPSSSPPSTPSRATDDLLNLAQQMTPSKPPEVMRRLRISLQSRANDVRDDVSTLKRRIVDLENQSATTARPRKQRKRLNRAAHADDSIENPQTIEDRSREAGRQFVVQEALFLVDADIFSVDEDEDFDPSDEFTSDKNKIQGQLRQILHYLPNDVKHLRSTDLISGAFIDGMSQQRSSTSNRLRGASLGKIVDDVKPFATSSGRFNAFAKFIGYQPGTETREPYYSKLDVPVLYDGWQGSKDLNTLFRGPALLKIQASVIRGPNGADGLFSGKSKRPLAKTVERMYKIRNTTAGVIANCGCLAVWLYSADTQLVEIGDETGINYKERYIYYLQRILDGLANDKAWALGLIAYWNKILFPDVENPQDNFGSAGNEELEAREQEDDLFNDAPALQRPGQPTRDTRPSPSPSPSPQPRRSTPAARGSHGRRDVATVTAGQPPLPQSLGGTATDIEKYFYM